ncbi:MAG: hypothetical protein AAGC49_05140 [Brevundimonas sp.]
MIVGLAVAAAAVIWTLPARPPARPRSRGRERVAPGPGSLSGALVATAAQLRAGASPPDAWRRAFGPSLELVDDVPSVRGLVGRPGPDTNGRALAVAVAAGSARALGAPLADVLDRVALSVAADEEAVGELRAATAGPRATARVLAWLPVLGLLVASALGADPVGVLLGGGPGSFAALVGLGLLLLGRLWTRALVARVATSAPARPRHAVLGRRRAAPGPRRGGSAW